MAGKPDIKEHLRNGLKAALFDQCENPNHRVVTADCDECDRLVDDLTKYAEQRAAELKKARLG